MSILKAILPKSCYVKSFGFNESIAQSLRERIATRHGCQIDHVTKLTYQDFKQTGFVQSVFNR